MSRRHVSYDEYVGGHPDGAGPVEKIVMTLWHLSDRVRGFAHRGRSAPRGPIKIMIGLDDPDAEVTVFGPAADPSPSKDSR